MKLIVAWLVLLGMLSVIWDEVSDLIIYGHDLISLMFTRSSGHEVIDDLEVSNALPV